MTNRERITWTTVGLIIVFLIGLIIGMSVPGSTDHAQDTSSADITVMPCSAWNNHATPTIPANTLTDACVDSTGTLHTAPTSMEKTR